MKRLPRVNINVEYVPFRGGLDQETPAMLKPPGGLDISRNYVAESTGGYSRIDGYERYSGQPSPSDATYYYVPFTATATVTVGNDVTGVTSMATGTVITVGTGYINITKVVGTFEEEVLNVSGSPVGSITGDLVETGEPSVYDNAVALAAAADEYRGDIVAPAGSGAIRGIAVLKGVTYCFRDDDLGTAGLIYKATTSGWVEVTLYNEISFNTGSGLISEGDTITGAVSGATAEVKRVVLESGEWGGATTAAGRLIIGTVTGGPFQAENLTVTGVEAVAVGAESAITILPGGRYETVNYNFYGSTDTKRIYGADGVNRGFEFDGTVYVPIDTGMTTDTPEHVYAHKGHLFFSFNGSSINSGTGFPYKWTAISGAVEIAVGDNVTGYAQLPGKALAIFARNRTEQLLGSTELDFTLDTISDEVGCIPYTAQKIGYAYALDDRGINLVYPSDKYGNFEQNTISRRVQQKIDALREVVTASVTYKTKNQYRLYGSDGTGISMTILDKGYAFMPFYYPDNIVCAVSGEDSTGKDVVFLGSDAGMVYQADKGSSFDGDAIEAFLGLSFNNSKTPANIKSYQRVVIDLISTGYTSLSYYPNFSSGNTDIATHIAQEIEESGSGGYWDIAAWDSFYYDGVETSKPNITIAGDGTNMAMTIYGNSAIDLGHTLDGMVVHYIIRRTVR